MSHRCVRGWLPRSAHFAHPAIFRGLLLIMSCANVASLQLARGAARQKEWPAAALGPRGSASHRNCSRRACAGNGRHPGGTARRIRRLGPFVPWDHRRFRTWRACASTLRAALHADCCHDDRHPLWIFSSDICLANRANEASSRAGGQAGKRTAPRAQRSGDRGDRPGGVLLVGSGLLARSFIHLISVDPGFDPHHLLTLRLSLSGAEYSKPSSRPHSWAASRTSQGATGHSVCRRREWTPYHRMGLASGTNVEGKPQMPVGLRPDVPCDAVSPGYFELGYPLVAAGVQRPRPSGAPQVAIVNRAFVHHSFQMRILWQTCRAGASPVRGVRSSESSGT